MDTITLTSNDCTQSNTSDVLTLISLVLKDYAILDSNGYVTQINHNANIPTGSYTELSSFTIWPELPYKHSITVVDGVLVANDIRTLAETQSDQCDMIDAAYFNAIQANISFTTVASVTQTFQADSGSQTTIVQAVLGFNMIGSVPSGFAWKSLDNTMIPFTLADLQGLYGAMLMRGNTLFNQRTTLKASIMSASTLDAVKAINWS